MSDARSAESALVSLNDLVVSARYVETLKAAGLVRAAELFESHQGQSLNKPGLESWRRRYRLELVDEGAPREFYLKLFVDPPRRSRREIARSGSGARSVAGVEWSWMRQLAAAGIPCPEPVALAEELIDGREVRSAVLMRSVPGRSLERWAEEWRLTGLPRPAAVTILERTADLVARLHGLGLVHRDLYLSHVFWCDRSGPQGVVSLIDLQRLLRMRWLRRRWVVKDLAALHYSTPRELVSRSDRVRWLKRYLGVSKLGKSDKRLARAIGAKGRRLAAHDRRRRIRLESWESSPSPPGARC